jgi:hypothetical protein
MIALVYIAWPDMHKHFKGYSDRDDRMIIAEIVKNRHFEVRYQAVGRK